jgi:arginase
VVPRDVVYIGLRDLDEKEKAAVRRLGIKAFTMYDIDRMGIGRVMEETLHHLRGHSDLHLSFDIDAIDPFFAPHTGTAVTGGLTYREGNYICEALFASQKLSSMELVEVDPAQHPGVDPSKTVDFALTLIGSAMGKSII